MAVLTYVFGVAWVLGLNATYDDLSLKRCNASSPWTIHGWWPESSPTKWPQFCDPSRYGEFTASAIAPIRSEMNVSWDSCPGFPSAFGMWRHEWKKHGTCVQPRVSVLDYFNHTLRAFNLAKSNNFYGCCGGSNLITSEINSGINSKNDIIVSPNCLIPFALPINETKWLGYCK